MTGRLADLFRFAWGLLYWNTRKSWFRLRRPHARCPCQSPSDSGRALETACEACLHWHDPARFQRVCPLLVATPDGYRCSVDTADVRPFWRRAFGYYGGTLLGLYLAAALSIFAVLRGVGYPISIVHLVWPGSWHRIGEVRGWYFMDRSTRAFNAGRPAEGMLYLRNAYEFEPTNLSVALTLAQKLQLGQPIQSDQIYQRLLREHPPERDAIAQRWFRSLLSRGAFATVQSLAASEVVADTENSSVWMRALLFANRRTGDTAALEALLASSAPAAVAWRPVLRTELLVRRHRNPEALDLLHRPWTNAPAYALVYQASELAELGDALAAVDVMSASAMMVDDTARASVLLHVYAVAGANQNVLRLASTLLEPPLNSATIALLSSHLVRHPNSRVLNLLYDRLQQDKFPLRDDTLQAFLCLLCAAGANQDAAKMHTIGSWVRSHASGNAITLNFIESFFERPAADVRATAILPALPIPLEMYYALLERYPGRDPNGSR